MKTTGLTLEWALRKPRRGQPTGSLAGSVTAADRPGKLPRVTRLMALAIKFQGMVDSRFVRDYAAPTRFPGYKLWR